MFVDRDDRALMEAAIAAGVSSFNVVDTAFPDIKPIVMAAVAIFRKHQQLADDLSKARATLLDRETINKAKALLMRQRNIDEPRAYRWLRRRAITRTGASATSRPNCWSARGERENDRPRRQFFAPILFTSLKSVAPHKNPSSAAKPGSGR